MQDLVGHALAVGDRVAITQTGYRNMVVGTIVKATPKGMKVLFKTHSGRNEETFRTSGMVSKIFTTIQH